MKWIIVGLVLVGATVATPNTWRVGRGDVRVTCPMTIGGSFDAKTTALTGAVTASARGSRAFDGSLTVDLRTLDTGIGLRNEHLRENYLEVDKGPVSRWRRCRKLISMGSMRTRRRARDPSPDC
jgi:hypothetical protein